MTKRKKQLEVLNEKEHRTQTPKHCIVYNSKVESKEQSF